MSVRAAFAMWRMGTLQRTPYFQIGRLRYAPGQRVIKEDDVLLIASGMAAFQVVQLGLQREDVVSAQSRKELDAGHAGQLGGAPGRQPTLTEL